MAVAIDCVRCDSHDASAWDAADGAVVSHFTMEGTSSAVTDTTLTDDGEAFIVDEWIGEVVTSGGKTLTVTSNTATVLTGSAGWSGGGNPGTGVYTIDKGMIDDLTVNIFKQGKSPDDICRVTYDVDPADLLNTDTITINIQGLHNYVTGVLLPYDAATTVKTTNKITYTAATGDNVITLTTAFIGDLADQGDQKGASGRTKSFAVRFVEDQEINGDAQFAEVDANLTIAAAGGRIMSSLVMAGGLAGEGGIAGQGGGLAG